MSDAASQLLNSIDALDASSLDSTTQAKLLVASRALTQKLETPWDRIVRTVWEEPLNTAAINLAVDFDIFQVLVDEQAKSLSSAEVAKRVNADPTLTMRILRSLAATKAIGQVDIDQYSANDFSRAATTPEGKGALGFYFSVRLPTVARITEYFSAKQRRNPESLSDCPWKEISRSELTWFDWLQATPKHLNEFTMMMKGYATSRPAWTDLLPAARIFDGDDGTSTLLVDIGGGVGDSIGLFLRKYPQASGRLVLQDQASVIERAIVPQPAVAATAHDLFHPQPVHGARFYFLRMVLHDWSDAQSREILLHTRRAMKPGYSAVLINEMVVSASAPAPFATAVDLLMMTFMGAKERGEDEWVHLLKSVGLRLVHRWQSPTAEQNVIEAELDPAWTE